MSIVLIAPYPDLIETARETLPKSKYPVQTLLGDLEEGVHAARRAIADDNVHAIVSRGGTASLLRQSLAVPVFEIEVTGFDLLRAIYPHVKNRRRTAVVGYENVVSGARGISETLGVDLGCFLVDQDTHIERVVREAIEWGAEVVVGDTVSVNTARSHGIASELVRSGPEAILLAVEAAGRFLEHMRDEVLRNERLSIIMDHADRGVLYLAPDRRIELMNAQAERILKVRRERMLGLVLAADIVPNALAIAVQRRDVSQLIQLNGRDYIIEVLEIQNDNGHAATLVFLQSSGRIRDLEGMIRRQLTARGLVATYRFEMLVANSPIFQKTVAKAIRYSRTDATILLLGETGSGKEVFAQSIHNASSRRNGPFVAVNCAALPDTLLESELFGYAEGAFTGASKGGKQGLFEMAHTGTIFLDEVSDMSANVQARFLRVLQEKQVMRIGDNRVYDVDVRVIAACNTDLLEATETGHFREDLYYRLKILDIEIPALRARPEDIVPLFSSFLARFSEKHLLEHPSVPPRFLEAIHSCPWPGNVRQLRNFAEKASVLFSVEQSAEDTIDDLIQELRPHNVAEPAPAESPSAAASARSINGTTLRQLESSIIRETWLRNGRNVSATARELEIDRATVRKNVSRI